MERQSADGWNRDVRYTHMVPITISLTTDELKRVRAATMVDHDEFAVKAAMLRGVALLENLGKSGSTDSAGVRAVGTRDAVTPSNDAARHITYQETVDLLRKRSALIVGMKISEDDVNNFWDFLVLKDFKNRNNQVVTTSNCGMTFNYWYKVEKREAAKERQVQHDAETACRHAEATSRLMLMEDPND